MNSLPETGFLRLAQIVGQKPITLEQADRNRAAGQPHRRARSGCIPLIPVSESAWWAGVKSGRYPKPVKLGGSTFWRVEDIRAFIARTGGGE